MTTLTTFPHLSLSPVTITDWLPKLGEKAFLAWLNFRVWMEESHSAPSGLLPLPLNQIIKRLRVGNTTFYNQILRPLWNVGLIDLHKTPGMNQFHLIVYSYPQNLPEKEAQSLEHFRDYDRDFQPDPPLSTVDPCQMTDAIHECPHQDTLSHPYPDQREAHSPDKNGVIPSDPSPATSHYSSIQENDPVYEVSHQNPKEKGILSFPQVLSDFIRTDPQLVKYKESIIRVYHACHQHPLYSHDRLIKKVRDCLPYSHVHNFQAYLLKAILNEWDKPQEASCSVSKMETKRQRPRDVPEWVWRQQYGPPQESKEFTAEQKDIAEKLLKELEEVTCDWKPPSP